MGERTRLGLGLIGVALVLGVLGDILLRATPWGVNFFVWITLLVGLAVSFGAQSLVKDVISGFFILMENQFGVGDVIDMGEASGTVEAVGLRVTRLRAVDGTVWYVRNGEVIRVGNSQAPARPVY